MPKSRTRKGHASKSKNRTEMLKRQKEKSQREFMDMIKGMQQQQQQPSNVVQTEELGDIGNLELELD